MLSGMCSSYGMRANVVVAAGRARKTGADAIQDVYAVKKCARPRDARGNAHGDSRPGTGMTTEPGDAETCLHVSISGANNSSPVRGMTCKARQ